MKSFLLFLALLTPSLLMAMPTFSYESAVSWADKSTSTDVPKAERIYILGPEKVPESYVFNGKVADHDVYVRRIVRHRNPMTLGVLLENLHLPPSEWNVCVYRDTHSTKPTIHLAYPAALESEFSIRKGDVVLLEVVTPGLHVTTRSEYIGKM